MGGRKEGRTVLVRLACSSVCTPSGEGAAMCLTDAEVCSVSKVDKEAVERGRQRALRRCVIVCG